MSSWGEADKVEGQMGQLDLSHHEASGHAPEAAHDNHHQPQGSSAGSEQDQASDQGQAHGDHPQGHRGGGHRGHTYRRRGRGGGYRGRGRGSGGQHADEGSADANNSQWNGGERDSSRGRGQSRRFYRGGGTRQRTRSEKSSLLDGMRDPLPQSERSAADLFEDVEDFWDVVVAGYGPEMTEDDLWDIFGQRDVADIIQFVTQDMKPYCHIYTTSKSMTSELLKCNRDTFRGQQLQVALSEDMISRSVSQLLKKKPQKAKGKQRYAPAAASSSAAPEQQENEEESQENEEEPPPAAASSTDAD